MNLVKNGYDLASLKELLINVEPFDIATEWTEYYDYYVKS